MSTELVTAAKGLSWFASFGTAITLGITRTLVGTPVVSEPFNWLEWGGQIAGIGVLIGVLSTFLVKIGARFFDATDTAHKALADENVALRAQIVELNQECRTLRAELHERLVGGSGD